MAAERSRVLIAVYFDAKLPGGGNEYSFGLAREWLKAGLRLHVIGSDYKRDLGDLRPYAESGQLTIHPVSAYGRVFLAHEFRQEVYDAAKEIIGQVQPESIHIHNFHGLLGAVWAAVDSGRKTIYTALDFGLICQSWYLHDGSPAPCPGPSGPKCNACLTRQNRVPLARSLFARLPAPLMRLLGKDPSYHQQMGLLRDYSRRADSRLERMLPLVDKFAGVVTISPVTGELLGRWGLRKEKIFFHPQGINRQGAAARPAEERKAVRLLFLGHMAPIKGFDVLAEAAEALPAGLDLEIVIYGPQAKKFVRASSENRRRYFVARDFLVGDQVDDEVFQSDGVVIPSRWHENTPFALIRSLAAGRPVLAADQKGLAHLLREGVNGFLLPPNDPKAWRECLLRVAQRPSLLRDMRPNCRYAKTVADHAREVESVVAAVKG